MRNALDDPRAVLQPGQRIAHSIVGLALIRPVKLGVGVRLQANADKFRLIPIRIPRKFSCTWDEFSKLQKLNGTISKG